MHQQASAGLYDIDLSCLGVLCVALVLCSKGMSMQALTSGPCVYAGLGSSTAPGAGVSAVVHTLMQPSSAQLIRCPCSIAALAQP